MAEPKKISELPDAVTLTGTEEVPALQTGTTVKATAQNIANLSAGEANTASNVGAGVGEVFKQKTGVDLEMKTIKAGTGISISNDTNEVTIASTITGGKITPETVLATGDGQAVFSFANPTTATPLVFVDGVIVTNFTAADPTANDITLDDAVDTGAAVTMVVNV